MSFLGRKGHHLESLRLTNWLTVELASFWKAAGPLNFFARLCTHFGSQLSPDYVLISLKFYHKQIDTDDWCALPFFFYFSWQLHFTVIGNRFMGITYLLSFLFKFLQKFIWHFLCIFNCSVGGRHLVAIFYFILVFVGNFTINYEKLDLIFLFVSLGELYIHFWIYWEYY